MEAAHPQPNPCMPGPAPATRQASTYNASEADTTPTPALRQSRIRDLLPVIIHEALRVGGRPDSSIGKPTQLGEKIEVRTRSSNGHASFRIIEWSVQPDVPEVLPLDERDLSKLVSCIFLNAVKFTENGTIAVVVSLSKSLRSARINIIDSGAGIPKDFLPELFKPFSREDDSLTRSREGLGLGLLVAKGLARKLGGDLYLVRTDTWGQSQGSEFEIKVPIAGIESGSRPDTPLDRTPTPSSTSPLLLRSGSSYMATSFPKPAHTASLQASSDAKDNVQQPIASSQSDAPTRSSIRRMSSSPSKMPMSIRSSFDRKLAEKHPLTFLVAEDNKINRKLLVSMLAKLGYKDIYEAHDGREAVRIMKEIASSESDTSHHEHRPGAGRALKRVDVILMDLWMPEMDGYEATEKILDMFKSGPETAGGPLRVATPTVLAVSADVTEKTNSRARTVGMEGFMTKPYTLVDLQRLIEEICSQIAG
jgi:CheY-like chemotaxis protein